jgi:hypothetical protein
MFMAGPAAASRGKYQILDTRYLQISREAGRIQRAFVPSR